MFSYLLLNSRAGVLGDTAEVNRSNAPVQPNVPHKAQAARNLAAANGGGFLAVQVINLQALGVTLIAGDKPGDRVAAASQDVQGALLDNLQLIAVLIQGVRGVPIPVTSIMAVSRICDILNP